ncbi:DHA1 family bicyclomycin/chloramphenicol resistance-like MFS transporter [Stella humosa]|uniref:Bcr/CflA family efflux transporter n=1 Tax=Stella humosa TaxID=94 RepID=A0A3N1L1B9_9PROT|nr:multidrug effflux MFS transporter [Stella humosa]ROP84236.1 DHA1 family bicyclomycin/chloramphenicol resistance-like MFS transporter [Stella humosa]BBK33748.1 Bcr/CflA family drug resistance efflux transporter [Stella humosa]
MTDTTPDRIPLAAAAPVATARLPTPGLLAVLGGLAALAALSTNIILPSFPGIAATLGVATPRLGVTLSAFFFVFALGQLVVGPLSDRMGRRNVVLGGMVVFLAGSLLCAVADDLGTLVAGRVVQALGVCTASVLSRAIARDLFEGEALARVLSLTMVAMAAAPGFSPLLGSALDQWLGWRAAFVLVGLAGIVAGLLYATQVGETHPPARRRPIAVPAILRGYFGLAGDRRFVLPALAVGLVSGGLYGMFAASPAILMQGYGLTATQLGLFFAASVFMVFGAGLAAPRVARRLGLCRAAALGVAIALLGGSLLAALGAAGPVAMPAYVLAIAIFLFGMGLANPLSTAMALQPFGSQAGLASALLGFLQMAGAGLGATLATGLAADPLIGLGIVLAGFTAIALPLFLGLPGYRPPPG